MQAPFKALAEEASEGMHHTCAVTYATPRSLWRAGLGLGSEKPNQPQAEALAFFVVLPNTTIGFV